MTVAASSEQKTFNELVTSPNALQLCYDIACEGLASQEFKQSVDKHNRCVYRSADPCGNTLKCAIGHLIADSEYEDSLEGAGIQRVLYSLTDLKYDFKGLYSEYSSLFSFLAWLQSSHDAGMNAESMKQQLRNISRRFDLTIPECVK